MATDEAVSEENSAATAEAQSNNNSVMIKIGALLAIVLAIQVTVVLMFVNPAANGTGDVIENTDVEGDDNEGNTENTAEVEIDSFSCANTKAIPSSVVNVSFDLSVLVSTDNQASFEDAVTRTSNKRVREAVEKVARSAELNDLNDSNLGTIKLKIKEEINRVLRKSYVEHSIISKFHIIEQ